MTTLDRIDAQALIRDFDAAEAAFVTAFDGVPDAALQFRPDGDDYALSGLLVHVAGALEHYGRVLVNITTANFGPVAVNSAPDPRDEGLLRHGVAPADRVAALRRIRAAHARLTDQVRSLHAADIGRQAPVRFAADSEPLPTSAVDIVGWMRDHYHEHVSHIDELLARWRRL
jgi:hypothetical protein